MYVSSAPKFSCHVIPVSAESFLLYLSLSLIFMTVKVSKSCLLCKINNLKDNAGNLRDSVILAIIIITICKSLFKYVFIDSNLSVKKISEFVYSQQEQTSTTALNFDLSVKILSSPFILIDKTKDER